MPTKSLPAHPSLEHLRYQAKDLLKAAKARSPEALARTREFHPNFDKQPQDASSASLSLSDAQLVVAREYGFESWPKLKLHVESVPSPTQMRPSLAHYETIAADLLEAFRTGNPRAMQTVWTHSGHRRTWPLMREYVLLDLGKGQNSESPATDISLDDAQRLVARSHGFEGWPALVDCLTAVQGKKTILAAKPVKVFAPNTRGRRQTSTRVRDWESVFSTMREQQLAGLDAEGQMTDALLKQLSRLEHITSLDLNGSHQLTDAGVRFLANMPRLERLDLSGTGITDRGLEILPRLKRLKSLQLSWTGITDAGAAYLGGNEHLERIDLIGTQTGDAAIKALIGKPHLRHVMTGAGVTDEGIGLFHDFPVFKTWQGGEPSMGLTSYEAGPNYLGLRGTFTNRGFADLAGLDGLFALNVDDRKLAITAAALPSIANLPHLGWLAFDAKDDAMPHIAAMPKLRFLLCQDTEAGDDGFVALSRSRSIEYIWGRRCHNLRSRGFTALATMPSLRGLSVSCKNVDDDGVAALPRFPALRELMPMDVPDAGYRHIGQCEKLESLVLMYCRDTSDAATEHLAGLPGLKKYFASYTKITDRSMEVLSRMDSLESISFYGCPSVTNAGVMALARLPRLRELTVSGPNINSACAATFPAHVKAKFSD
jgi:Leucine-rich repeat (LRR) protein